jgi:hypothetical protein
MAAKGHPQNTNGKSDPRRFYQQPSSNHPGNRNFEILKSKETLTFGGLGEPEKCSLTTERRAFGG